MKINVGSTLIVGSNQFEGFFSLFPFPYLNSLEIYWGYLRFKFMQPFELYNPFMRLKVVNNGTPIFKSLGCCVDPIKGFVF